MTPGWKQLVKVFFYVWEDKDRLVTFYKWSIWCRGFKQWGYPRLLECGEGNACVERCVDYVCEWWQKCRRESLWSSWENYQLLERWWKVAEGGRWENWMFSRVCVCLKSVDLVVDNEVLAVWEKEENKDWCILRSGESFDLCRLLSAALSLVWCSWRTSDYQGLEGVANAGLEKRKQILSRLVDMVENKVSVALFTFNNATWVGGWYNKRKMRGGKGTDIYSGTTKFTLWQVQGESNISQMSEDIINVSGVDPITYQR